jgi:hypothetical protein
LGDGVGAQDQKSSATRPDCGSRLEFDLHGQIRPAPILQSRVLTLGLGFC